MVRSNRFRTGTVSQHGCLEGSKRKKFEEIHQGSKLERQSREEGLSVTQPPWANEACSQAMFGELKDQEHRHAPTSQQ